MDLEAKLDRGVKALVGRGPADYAPEDWISLREHLRLEVLYPGKYVAYWNHYQGGGDCGRLARRDVLFASRSLAAVQKRIAQLSEEERRTIRLTVVDKPNGGLWV
jgi:hypothetical protein